MRQHRPLRSCPEHSWPCATRGPTSAFQCSRHMAVLATTGRIRPQPGEVVMPFPGYLGNADLAALTKAAQDGDLLDVDRKLHLQGIFRGFAVGLTRASNPLDQFQLDLDTLNFVERLENGEVPLVQFLQNMATQLKL